MTLKAVFSRWAERYFSDEEAITLLIMLVIGFATVIWLGQMLAPFFTALVLAFLLQGLVNLMTQNRIPEKLAVSVVFIGFIGAMFALAFVLMPLLWNQLGNLAQEVPKMLSSSQQWLDELQSKYPNIVTPEQIQTGVSAVTRELNTYAQRALSLSLSSLGSVIALIIYVVLVPILIFFMLKDREKLVGFTLSMIPEKRVLMSQVWREMDHQIANYVRGKVVEILIVGSVTFITFSLFGLPYSALLSVLVGFSVLVPFIGAAVATLPVAAVAGFHFGLTDQFAYVIIAYGVIQALDGNVLVPVLFSEAVNLHPVSIIVAVLFFGGIWGLWGVFFAIPLATLLKALITAWPRGRLSRDAES
jgi:putative permease